MIYPAKYQEKQVLNNEITKANNPSYRESHHKHKNPFASIY